MNFAYAKGNQALFIHASMHMHVILNPAELDFVFLIKMHLIFNFTVPNKTVAAFPTNGNIAVTSSIIVIPY